MWSATAALLLAAAPWQVVAESPYLIRTRELSPGVAEFRAEGLVIAPVAGVAKALSDPGSFASWMPYTAECRVLSQDGDGTLTVYTRANPPFIANRDFITRTSSSLVGNVYVNTWVSAPDAMPPQPGVVRVRVNSGHWRFEGVQFVYQFTTETGSVPGWLRKLATTRGIVETIRAVEARANAAAL
jgi:hypothetical protein